MLTIAIPSTSSVQMATKRADPRRVPGLAMWYDASQASTVVLENGKVVRWIDLSPNECHLVQSDTSLQPLYGNQTRAGRTTLELPSGNLQRLQTALFPTSTFFGPSRNSGTFFSVLRRISGRVGSGFQQDGGVFGNSLIVYDDQTYFGHGYTVDTSTYGSVIFTGGYDIFAHVVDIPNLKLETWRNGVLHTTKTLTNTNPFDAVNMYFRIGWDSVPFNAYHAEHIHYRTVLNATHFSVINSYLLAKWGAP